MCQLILNTGHSYGTIDETVEIVKTEKKRKKGKDLDTLEKYCMYLSHQQNVHLNNTYTDNHSPIFNCLYHYYQKNNAKHKNVIHT